MCIDKYLSLVDGFWNKKRKQKKYKLAAILYRIRI